MSLPPVASLVGGTDGTDLRPISTDAYGTVQVNLSGITGGVGVPILGVDIEDGVSDTPSQFAGTSATNPDEELLIAMVVSGVSGYGIVGEGNVPGPSYLFESGVPTSAPDQGVALLVAGSYNSEYLYPFQMDANGNLLVTLGASSSDSIAVAGTVSNGSAASDKPVLVAGSDGTDVRNFLTDSSGQLKVLVESIPAVAITGSVAVTGTFYQATQPVSNSALNFDGSGNLKVNVEAGGGGGGAVYGPTASGSAPANPPVLHAGWDGTDVRTLLTDTAGQLKVLVENSPTVTAVGAAAAGSAPSGNPVTVAGWDGTDVRLLLTDNLGGVQVGGSVIVAGAVADGSPPSTAPVVVAGYDGTDIRFLLTDNTGQQKVLIENSPAVTITSGTVTAITDAVTVVGNVAAGSGISGDPVQVAGSDGTDVRRLLTDANGALLPSVTATIKTGQVKVATTGTAVQIDSSSVALTQAMTITARQSNVASLWLGGSSVANGFNPGTDTGYELFPGASITLPLNNADVLYINGTAADGVTWIGA